MPADRAIPIAGAFSPLYYCLLVEDDPLHAEVCGAMLRRQTGGFQVVWARSCAQARELAALRARWDCMLIDLRLPDGEGESLIAPLAQRFPEVPIIVLTSRDDEVHAAGLIAAGAQDYLIKGQFNQAMLLRAIRFAQARGGC